MGKLVSCAAGLIAALFACAPAQGQSLDRKVKDDKVISVRSDDPQMADAMRRARETLPVFLKMLPAPPPSVEYVAVKIGLREKNNDNTEFVWVGKLRQTGEIFSGVIGNRVELLKTYRHGQMVSFRQSDIIDWTYKDDTGRKGNYTSCVLLRRENSIEAESVIKQLGLDCSWFGK